MTDPIKLPESWDAHLAEDLASPRMQALWSFPASEQRAGKQIFPKQDEWFRALDLTPLDKVRVVILGQDPYHGEGQAHGLCFSVKPGKECVITGEAGEFFAFCFHLVKGVNGDFFQCDPGSSDWIL